MPRPGPPPLGSYGQGDWPAERLLGLHQWRLDIKEALADVGAGSALRQDVHQAALPAFADHVMAPLAAWRFPDAGSVWFDEREQDLVIGNRRRGSQGERLDGLSHSAFALGLMNACVVAGLPYLGFVILDLPLLNFRPPKAGETEDADTDADPFGEELK